MSTFYPEDLPPEQQFSDSAAERLSDPARRSSRGDAPPQGPTGVRRAVGTGTRDRARAATLLRWAAILGLAAIALVWLLNQREPGFTQYELTTFVEIDPRAPVGGARGETLAESEALARDLRARHDANGSYVDSAQELAWLFGVEIRWSTDNDESLCPLGNQPGEITAWYCAADGPAIVLNRNAITMPEHLYRPSLLDTVKHELAHHAITQRCGIAYPDAAGDTPEGATNSYAILYLDADPGSLTAVGPWEGEYGVDDDTDAAARAIHAGNC